ncbi:DUF3054 domain-containing protein [Arthrobacter agilis]|uniref:DUF3054 domain-containing protein n=1 Tax=Arthrobacter agilis TaxID=37921 RepID=A0A2L0UD93_9MICC|nr:DUF3054 domain-containing protein [Arthrobacter agilis]AUZ87187.1 DUF3054 domain-containing protein [Arthrobacter agilis]
MPRASRPPARAEQSPGRSAAAPIAWIALDAVLILAFAASGRRTHEHGVTVAGVLETAWPFLLAYAVCFLAIRAWRLPVAIRPTGLVLWLGTVAGGLALRALSGAGVAVSFQIVTLLVLGAFLLLPRVLARVRRGRRRRVRPVA